MATSVQTKDEMLTSLALPLRSVGANQTLSHTETMGEGKTFGGGTLSSDPKCKRPALECSFIDLGHTTILSGRTTPVHAWEHGTGASSITICYSGSPQYKDGEATIRIHPGDILAVPRNGGRISTGYLSSINFPIDHNKISRTMQAMHCEGNAQRLQQALALTRGAENFTVPARRLLFEFFAYVDLLLQESRYIGKALGLDEQIYRLLALAVDQAAGKHSTTQARWKAASTKWANPVDDLVDYIRANADRNLTLTDLEEQSHYSARHLQNLFRTKFDCTPMQFVRRQRLSKAKEKLQAADWDDSVTSISRNCGYRFTSNFSADFQREFGVKPSAVLRASHKRGGGALDASPINNQMHDPLACA